MSTDGTLVMASKYGQGRSALLSAVVRAVAQDGLRGVTYRKVAAEAGVAHTLVAHHFGSMDALIAEAMRYSLDRSVDSVTTRPGSGDIDALFAGLSVFAMEQADDQAFQFEIILEARRRPELRQPVHAIYETYVTAIHQELVIAGLDPDRALSHLVFAATESLILNQITHSEAALTEQSLHHLRTILSLVRDDRADSSTQVQSSTPGRRINAS